jgi:hypothetical protein
MTSHDEKPKKVKTTKGKIKIMKNMKHYIHNNSAGAWLLFAPADGASASAAAGRRVSQRNHR